MDQACRWRIGAFGLSGLLLFCIANAGSEAGAYVYISFVPLIILILGIHDLLLITASKLVEQRMRDNDRRGRSNIMNLIGVTVGGFIFLSSDDAELSGQRLLHNRPERRSRWHRPARTFHGFWSLHGIFRTHAVLLADARPQKAADCRKRTKLPWQSRNAHRKERPFLPSTRLRQWRQLRSFLYLEAN